MDQLRILNFSYRVLLDSPKITLQQLHTLLFSPPRCIAAIVSYHELENNKLQILWDSVLLVNIIMNHKNTSRKLVTS